MPFALGLDIPEWDDAGAPAAGLKKPKAQKRALPQGTAALAGQLACGVPAAAAAVAAAPQQKGAAAAAAAPLGTPRKKPAAASLAAPGTAAATAGKGDRKRKHEGPVGTVSSSPAPASAGGDGERGPAGAKKKKKRKGKHAKHKGDGGGDTASANGSPPPKGAAQQPREATEKHRLRPQQQQTAPATAASDAEHGQAGGAGKTGKKKKRKRKNKFLATGEDADAGAQGGARQADTPDQPESSRKKQKLERGQASGSGGDSPAAAGARSSASKRKEKMKQKGMGNVAAAASAERAGQAVKDAGVAGQARGREGGGKTGANELKAKERAEEREEKTEASTHSKFPFQQMSSIASNRKLTPLQAKLATKLQGAHFRMLNEELYTTPSSSAVAMFKKDPSLFTTYHEGFRSQTTKWPVNPVDVILKVLKKNPKWQVADLGCGDAKIAHSLPAGRVHSFDLVSVNEKVTACDIANVPLSDNAVDAVVLSLALMGTNYVNFLKEANRIAKMGARILVAEVRSRCEHVLEDFLALLQAMGFRVDQVDKDNKMFIMFYLTKVGKCGPVKNLDAPELKACQYKKR